MCTELLSLKCANSVLNNFRNLIDAANIAALAALLTFRRPECTLGGENSQDVIVHDPEVCQYLSFDATSQANLT